MSESMERAHETMHHDAHAHGDSWARGTAVLVSVLAAALAISEVAGKSAQTSYLTHHIELSDGWAFYQAKNLRQAVRGSEITILESLTNAADPAIQKRIQDARDYQARMRDDPASGEGMKQLAEKAKHKEEERAHAYHHYHHYEFVSGALQIAIVLSAASVVTRIRPLTIAAGLIGFTAGGFGLGVALGWI